MAQHASFVEITRLSYLHFLLKIIKASLLDKIVSLVTENVKERNRDDISLKCSMEKT